MTRDRRLAMAVAVPQRYVLGLLCLVFLVMTCRAVGARSDVVQERDGWTIERVFGTGSTFEGCGATTMSSDWRIGLAHSADGTWEVLFSRPQRPFEGGARYGVSLFTDRGLIYRGVAEVLPGGLVFLDPELSEAQVALLGRAAWLEFATRRGRKRLRLGGAQDIIEALRVCVGRNVTGARSAGGQAGRRQ
jgi:hypothetical protein